MTSVEERLDEWTGFRGDHWRHDIDVRGSSRDMAGLFAEKRRRGILTWTCTRRPPSPPTVPATSTGRRS